MNVNINVTVNARLEVEFEEVEPDGEPCQYCGETIFLKAWRACVYFGASCIFISQLFVCDACHDLVGTRQATR